MLVGEVMTTQVVTVQDRATLKAAIELLAEHHIAAMPVLDDRGSLVGVISEADVVRDMVLPDPRAHELPVSTSDPGPTRVADVMSNHPLTATSDTELARAADLITSTAVKSLPVVDHGKLVGMLSRGDIVRVLARRDTMIEADIDDLLKDSEQDWLVEVLDGVVTLEGVSDPAQERLAGTLVATVPGVTGVRFRPSRRSATSGEA